MNNIRLSIDGFEYEIIDTNGIFSYYKIIDNQRFAPSAEELKKILEELARINNQKLTFDDIKKRIKDEIEAKKITTYEELEKFLNTLGVVNQKEELVKYGKELLDKINLNITPIEELRNEIIEEYKLAMLSEKQMRIDFKVVDSSLEDKYMEVSMATLKGDTKFDYPQKYVRFNEKTREDLIIPIIREVILGSKIERSHYEDVNDLINDRVNYFLKTVKNCFVNIKNVERYYAREIEEIMTELKMRYGDNNSEERIEEINEELLDEQNVNELSNELDGPKLIRKKEENKGFVNPILIFIITEFFAALFIMFQMVLLK